MAYLCFKFDVSRLLLIYLLLIRKTYFRVNIYLAHIILPNCCHLSQKENAQCNTKCRRKRKRVSDSIYMTFMATKTEKRYMNLLKMKCLLGKIRTWSNQLIIMLNLERVFFFVCVCCLSIIKKISHSNKSN